MVCKIQVAYYLGRNDGRPNIQLAEDLVKDKEDRKRGILTFQMLT
jgi:hypothetical protein